MSTFFHTIWDCSQLSFFYIHSGSYCFVGMWICQYFCHLRGFGCLLPHCTPVWVADAHSPLPSHAWWTRDKCQRVNMSTATCLSPEWLHLACTTCHRQWKHTHSCTHTCRYTSNESNPEMYTNPRVPRAVLSSYVNYCMHPTLTGL